MPLADLKALIGSTTQNQSQTKAIAATHETLLKGAPSISGFTFLMNTNNTTNFGSGPGPVFNDENIYINIANALISGNGTASANFNAIAGGAGAVTLAQKVEAIYKAFVPASLQTTDGLAFLTRPDGLKFYQDVAAERGIPGDNGAAIVAFASLLKIAVTNDYTGIGDGVNDLINSINDGSSTLPETSATFIPIETVDGTNFDSDDGGTTALPAFTTGTDNLTGTTGNDNFTATTGTGGTLNSGDKLDAVGGTDKLVVTGGPQAGESDTFLLPSFTGLEEIELRGTVVPYDFGNSSGISSVTDNSSGFSSFLGGAKVGKFVFGQEKIGSALISQASEAVGGVSGNSVTVEFAGTAAGGASLDTLIATSSRLSPKDGPFAVNIISNGTNSNDGIRNTIKDFISTDTGATVDILGNDGMSFTLNSSKTPVVDASALNAGLIFTGNDLSNIVFGGKGANFIDTRKGQDDINITSSSSVTDKISFEGVLTSADFNIVRGFISGGGGDVISINASDTSAGTSASNPPVIQTVASKAALTSFNTISNDILELEFAIDFSSGDAVQNLINGAGGPSGIPGGGSGYIVAYSTAGEALLFYANDSISSFPSVFQNSEIQFVGILTGVSMGSMTTANFDLIP
jgi:hypothetical protein